MERKQVLLIDNDRFSLSVLQRLVDDLGYEPLIGSTLDAAQNLMETQKVTTSDIPVILLSQSSVRFSPRIENNDDNTVCFQKPIAIEPFVRHFRTLIGEAAIYPTSSA